MGFTSSTGGRLSESRNGFMEAIEECDRRGPTAKAKESCKPACCDVPILFYYRDCSRPGQRAAGGRPSSIHREAHREICIITALTSTRRTATVTVRSPPMSSTHTHRTSTLHTATTLIIRTFRMSISRSLACQMPTAIIQRRHWSHRHRHCRRRRHRRRRHRHCHLRRHLPHRRRYPQAARRLPRHLRRRQLHPFHLYRSLLFH